MDTPLTPDEVDRVPGPTDRCAYVVQAMNDKLMEHKEYIRKHGVDMPEVEGWQWEKGPAGSNTEMPKPDTAADNV